MKLSYKPLWWCMWGVGGVLWLVALIQFLLADTDTVIITENDNNNSPFIEYKSASQESISVSSTPVEDSVTNNEPGDVLKRDQTSPSFQQDSKDNCININTADSKKLVTLSGIGPVLAERIIMFRQEHGNFKERSDLVKVKGIGEGKLKKIIDHICL